MLRLSSKYLVEHLRIRCIQWLRADWPATLEGWERRERQATDDGKRYTPREWYVHPVRMINLARELGLDELLPAAFYDLSRYGPRKIAFGTSIAPSPCATDPPAEERIVLSAPDLYMALVGREAGQRFIAGFIEKELSTRPVSAGCAARGRDSGRACRESFYFIMLNVLRAVGGISAGRDADPLYTLVQAADMLNRKDFTDGEKQCGLQICDPCKGDFAKTAARARHDVWTLLPSWFGLQAAAASSEVQMTC